jgi:hypothetical protein
VLCASIWDIAQKPFGTLFSAFEQYMLLWGVLLALSFSGLCTLVHGRGHKWLLRGAAVVVALYLVLMFLISSDWAFHSGTHDYLLYSILATAFLFCVLTFVIAGMQPNPGVHTDAQDRGAPVTPTR